MKFFDVVLAAGVRTPFGDFGKSFKDVPLATLGTHAAKASIARAGLAVAEIDYFEINEAFAVVNLHAEQQLGIPRAITNLYGGGISLGHPPGATGIRMTMTAMQHLADTKGRYAIISMCLGSGMGMATLIEKLQR